MATATINTANPDPVLAPSAETIGDVANRIRILCQQASTLYFATLGIISFTDGSCPNPGDFDGVLAHSQELWGQASLLQHAFEHLPPIDEHAWGPAAISLDHEAHQAWRAWFTAATTAEQGVSACNRINDDPSVSEDTKAAADTQCDRLQEIASGLEATVAQLPASPVAVAAKLHIGLARSGGYPTLADREPLQEIVEAVLADLEPHLPVDMVAALKTPYQLASMVG